MLDIVLVNYNSTGYLLDCLGSVYDTANDIPFKVFVQDNASDERIEFVPIAFPQVTLTRNSRNIGFARAVNNGVAEGAAPYIVILNPDTVILDGFFDTALEYMEKNQEVGILGPRILDPNGAIQGSARAFPTPITGLFGRNTILTKVFPNNIITRKNVLTHIWDDGNPREIDWVSGACMLLRRKAVERVGLMDTRFFLYWEDADWCRRMWERGWKVVYHPKPCVVHYIGKSSATNPIRSLVEFHKSCYKLFGKYNRPRHIVINPFVAFALALRLVLSMALQKTAPKLEKLISRKRDKGLSHTSPSEKNGKTYTSCPPEDGKVLH